MHFDRYSDRARMVLGLARQEAGRLNHQYIGTEHLLLGLVLEKTGVACRVLQNLAIPLSEVVERVEKIVKEGPTAFSLAFGSVPFTPRAKKALELAAEEAQNLRHNYIGTEHLLIALVREGEGVAAQVLASFATAEMIREETLTLLGVPARAGQASGAPLRGGPMHNQTDTWQVSVTPLPGQTWDKKEHDEFWGTKLTFNVLRAANVKRCEQVFHKVDDWSPSDWATALAGEVGEACNEVKKLRRLDGADKSQDTEAKREELRQKIGVELADVIAYADLLAARMGIDLGAAVVKKFNEVSAKRGSTVFLR